MLRNKQGLTEEEFLKNYNADKYKKPSVSVDMILFTVADEEKQNYRKLPEKVLKVLMVKRANHPYIGQWALPGGFASVNESLDTAAFRELKEETNIDDVYMEQLYTWGDVGRDPRTRVISSSYMSLLDSSKLKIKAGDDAEDARWFTVKVSTTEQKKTINENGYNLQELFRLDLTGENEKLHALIKVTRTVKGRVNSIERQVIESKGIAFDHGKIIQYGIERLRNKIKYTDIAFNLMPEYFSLTELQQVYEVILDKELLKAGFRRKISGMVMETNRQTRDAGHRPSKLYRFNPNWVESIL